MWKAFYIFNNTFSGIFCGIFYESVFYNKCYASLSVQLQSQTEGTCSTHEEAPGRRTTVSETQSLWIPLTLDKVRQA